MPAEWAPHAATWISWPHNPATWPGRVAAAEAAMATAVAALSSGETVHVNVLDAAHARHVRERVAAAGATMDAVHCHEVPTNDAWCRDHGAIFVTRPGADAPLAALDFGFNAWGGKYPPWDLDDTVPAHMARILDVPRYACDMILEGGSVDVNGAGALITTEQCLLNPNRNPALSRADIEARLRAWLGVSQIIWLGEGIAGDDTDGHVDDITRFVAPARVLTAVAPADDPNHEALAANRARLTETRLSDGTPLEVLELPSPRLRDEAGDALPASYANFYIGNRVILLPGYGGALDAVAGERVAACFPERAVHIIDCRELVHGLGAFHCLTQQVPRA
jgi:agmatine deiminase